MALPGWPWQAVPASRTRASAGAAALTQAGSVGDVSDSDLQGSLRLDETNAGTRRNGGVCGGNPGCWLDCPDLTDGLFPGPRRSGSLSGWGWRAVGGCVFCGCLFCGCRGRAGDGLTAVVNRVALNDVDV